MQESFSLERVSQMIGMGVPWLRGKCASGGIVAREVGGEWFISRAVLERMSGVSIGEMERQAAARASYGPQPKAESDAKRFVKKVLADGRKEPEKPQEPKRSPALERVSSFTYTTVSRAKENRK